MRTCDNCGAFAFFGQAAPDECPFCASEKVQRKPGCLCQWEEGDSPCLVHGGESAATRTDLDRANLEHANLEHADLELACLEGANLRYANLRRADLDRANLEHANLEHVNLENVNLENVNLEGATFPADWVITKDSKA